MIARLGEFGRIAEILAPLTLKNGGAFNLTDDAALVAPDLVVTTDSIVEGVDFFPDDPPGLIARKLLRVNLSDLAAMGARPECYLLTTILPARCDDGWIRSFAEGLAADQATYGIHLIGGDTGSTPGPITLSATLFGRAPAHGVVRRSGARPDDLIYVTGTLGDSALGLMVLTRELSLSNPETRRELVERYHLPRPRTALGSRLPGLASAMIDISDGLVADLDHLCAASGVSAVIKSRLLPISEAAAAALADAPDLLTAVVTGGDDYELAFALPPEHAYRIDEIAAENSTAIRLIGRVVEGGDHRTAVLDADGVEIRLQSTGWRHA